MAYQPVTPRKACVAFQILQPEDGQIGFQGMNIPEEVLEGAPLLTRVALLCGTKAWVLIMGHKSPGEQLRRLGWPNPANDGIGIKVMDGGADCSIGGIRRSLETLCRIWPFEATIANSIVEDLDAALMCLARPPITGQATNAFCPMGSKGFMRLVPMGGINNPAAIPDIPDVMSTSSIGEVLNQIAKRFMGQEMPEEFKFPNE